MVRERASMSLDVADCSGLPDPQFPLAEEASQNTAPRLAAADSTICRPDTPQEWVTWTHWPDVEVSALWEDAAEAGSNLVESSLCVGVLGNDHEHLRRSRHCGGDVRLRQMGFEHPCSFVHEIAQGEDDGRLHAYSGRP